MRGGKSKITSDDMLEFAERRVSDVARMWIEAGHPTDTKTISAEIRDAVELAIDGPHPSELIKLHLTILQLITDTAKKTNISRATLEEIYFPLEYTNLLTADSEEIPGELTEDDILNEARQRGDKIGDGVPEPQWSWFCDAATTIWRNRPPKEAVFEFTSTTIQLKCIVNSIDHSGTDRITSTREHLKDFAYELEDKLDETQAIQSVK